MKIYFVMVLVLVAGAVPSDGRTESGIVFNKTHPHESMNNVTGSSSKVVGYGLLYLVMQWPRSFCDSISIDNRRCYQQVSGHFTVHGLWPQFFAGRSGLIDCTDTRSYVQYPPLNSRLLDPSLVQRLNRYWPDLTSFEYNNECFWASEYKKHGSCTLNNQTLYFDLTLGLVERLGISRITGAILPPGYYYKPSEIGSAVHRVTKKWPWVNCVTVAGRIQLLEIGFCVDRTRYEPYDCYAVMRNCGKGRVYLPRP